jgi:hypothetical protein
MDFDLYDSIIDLCTEAGDLQWANYYRSICVQYFSLPEEMWVDYINA